MDTVITIVPVLLGMFGAAFLCLLLILPTSPSWCENIGDLLYRRAAAKRAGDQAFSSSYAKSRQQVTLRLGGSIYEDALVAAATTPMLEERKVECSRVTTKSALRAGKR